MPRLTLKSAPACALLLLLLHGQLVPAQVPHLLHYQGRVSAQGTNYHGVGQFKFALVDPGSNAARQATATPSMVNGFIVSVTVLNGGAGYTAAPAVTVSDPTGSGALFRANLVNGSVSSISVLNAGFGYTAPVITVAPPANTVVYQTYWSQDGTSWQGEEPAGSVSLPVSQGLFSLLLGDTNLAGMQPLAPGAFAYPDVRLRVWFSPGSGVFTRLTPDQRIAAVGYAMMAETVPDGSITQGKLAPGSVGGLQLADGSITAAKLATNSGLGTPPGSIVMAANPNDTNLLAAGYTRLPTGTVSPDRWETVPLQNAQVVPRDLYDAVRVVGGDTLVVWNSLSQRGAYFSAVSNVWLPMAVLNAPSPRRYATAFWTSYGVFLWGGTTELGTRIKDGAIFDPKINRWTTIPTNGMPRMPGFLAWAGDDVVAWGLNPELDRSYYARFRLATQQWMPMSNVGAPEWYTGSAAPRSLWTGAELFVSGEIGLTNGGWIQKAARYSPSSDSWRNVSGLTNYYENLPLEDAAPYSGMFAFLEGNVYGWDYYLGARYAATNDSWSLLRQYVPNFGSSHVFRSKLYAIDPDVAAVYRYDPVADFWEILRHSILTSRNGDNILLATTNALIVVSPSDPTLALRYTPGQPIYLYEKR